MKCLNCDAEAAFKVKNDSSEDQFFCELDLPIFLTFRGFEDRTERLISGLVEDVQSSAPKTKKKKEAEPTPVAVEEPAPVVEEPVVTEVVEETPVE